MTLVGIIGGSGLDDPRLVADARETTVGTPFGETTSPITTGTIGGVSVAVIARHGRHHQFSPSQVNYRANIHALKATGATHIIATTACGSLRAHIGRGDFVIVDQFIDFTRRRENTFFVDFSDGTHHTAMADPFDPMLRTALRDAAMALGCRVHDGGTVVTIEGPRFSTRAESHMFRAWGGDVVNMSVATEAALATEAGIPYAAIAMSTDYDCWKVDEAPVTWEEILEVFGNNVDSVKRLLVTAISRIYQNAQKTPAQKDHRTTVREGQKK